MKLTICELSYLNELIISCINSITCMSLFRNQVTDEELKSLLDTHFPIHVEDYNRKVEFVKDAYTMSCNHSYEVYEWMAKNNYYPIVVATGEQTGDISSLYNNIPL